MTILTELGVMVSTYVALRLANTSLLAGAQLEHLQVPVWDDFNKLKKGGGIRCLLKRRKKKYTVNTVKMRQEGASQSFINQASTLMKWDFAFLTHFLINHRGMKG